MNSEIKNSKIAVAILAGGRSRPISNNANSRSQNVLELIKTLKDSGFEPREIAIVADDPIPFLNCNVRIIADKRKNIGPLAGIESALECFSQKYAGVLFLPADVQNLTVHDVIDLHKAYIIGGANVVFAQTKYEDVLKNYPLCAVVNCSVLDEVRKALDLGEKFALSLWRRLGALTINCNARGNGQGIFMPETWRKQKPSSWTGILFNSQKESNKQKEE